MGVRDRLIKLITRKRIADPMPTHAQQGQGTRYASRNIVNPNGIPSYTNDVVWWMEQDPTVRLANGVRNGFVSAAEIEVEGSNEQAVKWVQKQWDKIWQLGAAKLLTTRMHGSKPFEFVSEKQSDGWYGIKRIVSLRIIRCRSLIQNMRPVGVICRGQQLMNPRGVWMRWEPYNEEIYPRGIAFYAYPHWYLKWMQYGPENLTALYAMKHAGSSDVMWYPVNKKYQEADENEPTGVREVAYVDVLREVVENRFSLSSLILPMLHDERGNKLVEYEHANASGGASGNPFEWWMTEQNTKIFHSMGILKEVIEAGGTGSGFSGRTVPMMALLSGLDFEFAEIVRHIDEQYLRPMCWINTGSDPDYTIKPKPLLDVISEDASGSGFGGSALGGGAAQGGQSMGQTFQPQMSSVNGNGNGSPRFADDHADDAVEAEIRRAMRRSIPAIRATRADLLEALKKNDRDR